MLPRARGCSAFALTARDTGSVTNVGEEATAGEGAGTFQEQREKFYETAPKLAAAVPAAYGAVAMRAVDEFEKA